MKKHTRFIAPIIVTAIALGALFVGATGVQAASPCSQCLATCDGQPPGQHTKCVTACSTGNGPCAHGNPH